jgi:two-component system, sensor histidine kinase and response regulator
MVGPTLADKKSIAIFTPLVPRLMGRVLRSHPLIRAALIGGFVAAIAYGSFELLGGLAGGLVSVAITAVLALLNNEPPGSSRSSSGPPIEGEFIGRVSHEIRTPLNGILGLTQVLLGKTSNVEERELLEMIRASGDSLLRIINDLLDYSKLQAGKIRFESEEFRLRRLLRQSVRTLAPQAHVKGLELAFWVAPEVPDVVTGDPQRLRQVLSNLIVNAIKFTDEGGEILVEVAMASLRPQEDRVCFSVKDTGIGVSRTSMERIFGAFMQGDNAPSEHGGLGLGLAISSELVEWMGGSLSVKSEEGRGSTFRFDVRFEASRTDDEDRVPPSIGGTRALVVDDSRVQREVMAKQLAQLGCEVASVASHDEAIDVVERALEIGKPFSVFFLDSQMPGVDTFSVAREITKRSEIPGVLMALAHERVSPDALRAHGIQGYLTKPIAPSHLVRAIEILNRGSTVERPEDIQTQNMDRPMLAGLKVLVAEDHPVNRTVAVRALQANGCEVIAVPNGREALERWSKEGFDLLLLDLEMPEADGLTVVRRIRERERATGDHVPVVAFTAHAGDEDRERCFQAGMDGFVAKPFSESELAQAIGRVLRRPGQGVATAAVPIPTADKIFDRQQALKRANDDPALLGELTELFLQETPETLQGLELALSERDFRSVERLSHRLKGALLTLSASPAARAALELETVASLGDEAACHRAQERLREEIARLEAELKSVGVS